jgi:DNA polymerase I-like protein with 3'-5' exonuclease and polymerase domains
MLVAIDFETSGLDMYSPTSFVVSCAFAWRVGDEVAHKVYFGHDDIKAALHAIGKDDQVCVYNAAFEGLVLTSHFPECGVKLSIDVMRLVQNFDNGEEVKSFGLKDAVRRLLPVSEHDYEKRMNSWLKSAKAERDLIFLAPRDILEEYNAGDAINTLKIAEICLERFEKEGFNWKRDHSLYMSSAQHVTSAKLNGVKVNRQALIAYIQAIEQELKDNEKEFRTSLGEEIEEVERILTAKEQAKFKKKIVSPVEFNVDSNTHRTVLFEEVMKLSVKFRSPSGKPSLKKSHLYQFGDVARKLEKRKGRQIVLTQAKALLDLSASDGKWHIDLKLAGTSTSRFAGGSQ